MEYEHQHMDESFGNMYTQNFSLDGAATNQRIERAYEQLNNFNSNDTNALQRRLLELQNELNMLDAEHN